MNAIEKWSKLLSDEPENAGAKECPFCGSFDVTFLTNDKLIAAACGNCGAGGPVITVDDADEHEQELAQITWNRRAECKSRTGMVQA